MYERKKTENKFCDGDVAEKKQRFTMFGIELDISLEFVLKCELFYHNLKTYASV